LTWLRDFYEYMYAKEKSKVKELKHEIEILKKRLKEYESSKGNEENKSDEPKQEGSTKFDYEIN